MVCRTVAVNMSGTKKRCSGLIQKQRDLLSTGGGTRTHMRLLSPDFESGASANSATPA